MTGDFADVSGVGALSAVEMEDFAAALSFERMVLDVVARGPARNVVRLAPSGVRQCDGRTEAAVTRFDSELGLEVSLGNVAFWIQPVDVDPMELVSRAGR